MAFFTGNLFFNMSLVIKYDMLGQIVHFAPRRRRLRIVVIVFFSNHRMIGDDVVMAVQAFFHRRQTWMIGTRHVGMAIVAVDGFMPGM